MTTLARRLVLLIPVLVLLASCQAGTKDTHPIAAPALRVMSFNIRYGTAKDGANHWDHRKELCASPHYGIKPDVLGLQEALHFQNAFILDHLPGYAALGVAREDGRDKGEFTTLIYRKDRLALVDSGTFWLSETPDQPGSKSWDSSLPRIATWARFQDRAHHDREFVMLNTHFDHRGPQARLEAARLIRAFVTKKAGDLPVIITGDFNAAPGSGPHQRAARPDVGIDPTDRYVCRRRCAMRLRPIRARAHGFKDKPVYQPY